MRSYVGKATVAVESWSEENDCGAIDLAGSGNATTILLPAVDLTMRKQPRGAAALVGCNIGVRLFDSQNQGSETVEIVGRGNWCKGVVLCGEVVEELAWS